MKRRDIMCVLAVFVLSSAGAQTFTYDFSAGYEGWSGDFADYPLTDSVFYELSFERATLPAPLDTMEYALRISGNNHSDDLFMFIKTKVTGLQANTAYDLFMSADIASCYPTNATGVGGPPGEGVMVKAGATLIEPMKIPVGGYYQMNINKSNQSHPGTDMDTIGHVGVSDTTTMYAVIHRSNSGHPFRITTNAQGEVWVCVGTESAFEATSTLFFDRITLTFTQTTGIGDPRRGPSGYLLHQNYPNPFNPETVIEYSLPVGQHVELAVFDMAGRKVAVLTDGHVGAGSHRVSFNGKGLASGAYVYRIVAGEFSAARRFVLMR